MHFFSLIFTLCRLEQTYPLVTRIGRLSICTQWQAYLLTTEQATFFTFITEILYFRNQINVTVYLIQNKSKKFLKRSFTSTPPISFPVGQTLHLACGLWTDWGNATLQQLNLPPQHTLSSPKLLPSLQNLLKTDNFHQKSQHLTATLNPLMSKTF